MPVEKATLHDYVQPDMLEDRVYMRRPSFRPRLSATVLLIIANVVAFFVQSLLYASSSRFRIDDYLPLSLDGLKHGYLWQLLTFQFMHGGVFHLLFNCIAIFVFGRDVEEALGRKPFLTLYFSSGVIGGLVQILAGLLLHGPFAERVVGASAGAFGLAAAFALLFPDRILLLFFIIPIRAKYLLLLSVGVAFYGIVFPSQNINGPQIADAAHLGGIFTGIIFVRYLLQWNWHWPRFRSRAKRPLPRLVRVPSEKSALWGRHKTSAAEDLPPEEFLSKEVDPILDKISAQGIQSLTERERRILEAARQKMAKR
jgi:membrane associated rhomboid family serine protease